MSGYRENMSKCIACITNNVLNIHIYDTERIPEINIELMFLFLYGFCKSSIFKCNVPIFYAIGSRMILSFTDQLYLRRYFIDHLHGNTQSGR